MPTRKSYRRYTAPFFGLFGVITSNASSGASSLATDLSPWKSSLSQDDLLSDAWLYRPELAAANRLRRVTPTGYSPAAGTVTPDLAWTATPTNGEEVEVFGLIPPYDDGSETQSLHFFLNEGLKRCLVVDEFTFSPSSNTARRHSLATAAPWLDDPSYVYQVGILGPNDTLADTDPYTTHRVTGRRVKIGNVVYLEGFTAQTTDTVYVKCAKPAYYAIQAAGSGPFTQAGLALETDVGIPALEWAAAATMVEAWDRIAHLLTPGDGKAVKDERADAAREFSRLTDVYFDEPEQTFELYDHLMAFGPRGAYSTGNVSYDGRRMY